MSSLFKKKVERRKSLSRKEISLARLENFRKEVIVDTHSVPLGMCQGNSRLFRFSSVVFILRKSCFFVNSKFWFNKKMHFLFVVVVGRN